MIRNKEEERLQTGCIRWFDYQFPELSKLLFAVPNGGSRNKVEAYNLKRQGVRSGVSDLIFLHPTNEYSFHCIEFKSSIGRQSKEQKEFQQVVELMGGKYHLVRDFDSFVKIINNIVCMS